MLTDKTKTALYWILCVIGIVMAFAPVIINFDNRNDWCRIAMTTGFALTLLGMLIKPITRKELERGTAGNIFFIAICWSIIAFIWILEIENFTLPIIVIAAVDTISLIVLCWLAYKKKQRVKVLEEELENARNEKNEV